MTRRKKYPKTALIRLTEDEHKRRLAEARRLKVSLSRLLVHAGLTGKTPNYEDAERHDRAIDEVRRIGNNLNQIAKQLNAQRGTLNLVRVERALQETKTALESLGVFLLRG